MEKLDSWHKTKQGHLVFGLIELLLAFLFANLAIDRGTWIWYVITAIFLLGAAQNTLKLIGKIRHGKRQTS